MYRSPNSPRFLAVIFLALSLSGLEVGVAAQPSFVPRVIVFGEQREQIRNTPIEQRPYRPLHFYGNTVRRRHHQGQWLPRPQLGFSNFRF